MPTLHSAARGAFLVALLDAVSHPRSQNKTPLRAHLLKIKTVLTPSMSYCYACEAGMRVRPVSRRRRARALLALASVVVSDSDAPPRKLGLREHAALARRAASCAAVGVALNVPPSVGAEARGEAALCARQLTANLFYEGDLRKADADLLFYTDGTALLLRDFRRLAPLLVSNNGSVSLTPRKEALKAQFLADLRALVPFSLLAMNTWPITPAILRSTVTGEKSLLRRWRAQLLPSSFEDARLLQVQRARRRSQQPKSDEAAR